jgi:glycosyltransferase involved in cell wall biosynthesis
MSDSPDVSVVMSVYNGAAQLRESVESILGQEGVKLELILVNDGSTDESGEISESYASRDQRVTVVHQDNQGVTRALIRGCAAARAQYIARQDVGDLSMSGKLATQLELIMNRPDASLVSCSTKFVGPKGEYLYEVKPDPANATALLLTLEQSEIRGPSSHPSAIFSRALYQSVGGYRAAFYFAQDLDLWVRLAERGKHVVMPEILYQASVSVASISGLYRREQIETIGLILESARLRRSRLSDAAVLHKAATIRPRARRGNSRLVRARALYFVGSCLKRRNDPGATAYLKEALRVWPFHLKSAVRLLFG